jgi:uncharacterized Zn finger protein
VASVADLVEEPALAQLVGPEALDAGREVADAGGVRLVEFGPMRVVAEVDDGDELPARVELTSAGGELGWRCDCEEGRTGLGCRHLAAAGIETWRRSPMRRA